MNSESELMQHCKITFAITENARLEPPSVVGGREADVSFATLAPLRGMATDRDLVYKSLPIWY